MAKTLKTTQTRQKPASSMRLAQVKPHRRTPGNLAVTRTHRTAKNYHRPDAKAWRAEADL